MSNKWINKNDKEAQCPCWVWDDIRGVPVAFNVTVGFSDWTYWMPLEVPTAPPVPVATYGYGAKFTIAGDKYMLCQIKKYTFTLIGCDDDCYAGNRWTDRSIDGNGRIRFTLGELRQELEVPELQPL